MLIEPRDAPHITTFPQLFRYVLEHLTPNLYERLTVVFGPITANTEEEQQRNISVLRKHEVALSDEGWNVIAITSLNSICRRLVALHNIQGYPVLILDDLTVPIIESGYLAAAHVRKNYEQSRGTLVEHEALVANNVPIFYVP
jgi:hypothetical protein